MSGDPSMVNVSHALCYVMSYSIQRRKEKDMRIRNVQQKVSIVRNIYTVQCM